MIYIIDSINHHRTRQESRVNTPREIGTIKQPPPTEAVATLHDRCAIQRELHAESVRVIRTEMFRVAAALDEVRESTPLGGVSVSLERLTRAIRSDAGEIR
jgi:hypothetical protein